MPIASRPDEDVDPISVLVHRMPTAPPLAADGYEDFIEEPGITETTTPPFQLRRIVRAEFLALRTNRFVGDDDSPLGQEILNRMQAQGE